MDPPPSQQAFALSRHGDPTEYRKRKVALISGEDCTSLYGTRLRLAIAGLHGVLRLDDTFIHNAGLLRWKNASFRWRYHVDSLLIA